MEEFLFRANKFNTNSQEESYCMIVDVYYDDSKSSVR